MVCSFCSFFSLGSFHDILSISGEEGCSLCTPPVSPAPTVLPPAPWFGHPQTAAGAVGTAGTNKASPVELALPQLNLHLVRSRASCANADCDILGFRSPFIEGQGLLRTDG